MTSDMETVARLGRAVRDTAGLMDRDQAKFLVSTYYRWQEHRIALNNQARALLEAEHDASLVTHFAREAERLEKQMVSVLDRWTDSHAAAAWAKGQVGVGPVLSAGLAAHIDITKARTASSIWRFAGLDPTVTWGKGEKRPWNAELKVICWRLGQSIVRQSFRDNCYYGELYRQRKAYELERDGAGGNADTAAATLEAKKIQDPPTRAIYESGHLPAGRLDQRAKRWMVKLFLAHYHEVAYRDHYGTEPPAPYPIAHLGHVDKIDPPEPSLPSVP